MAEVTLVAITAGFGTPQRTAVLGHRVVHYWLPLLPGAVACHRLRLSPEVKNQNSRGERAAPVNR